ncbi:MAG: AmmeMemoRadiSam system protein B [Deltaproteobacteria bacterium]|nr:AmmeMemoRadiSam system protein B [Deltaproteobacteria bacterium]
MRVRPRMLPPGWYPGTKSGCESEIAKFIQGVKPLPAGTKVYGGMVPHAGWYFSGKLAARVFYLNAQAAHPEVVCIFGGHLGGASPPLLVIEDAWETPYGNIPLATEFYAPLRAKMTFKEEYPGDNTIEVNLPFVAHFFPKAKVLGIRAPQSARALELGETVAAVARELHKSILFFGSADLTHYGPNYGWAPKGFGPEAVKWVKEVNDKRFLDHVLKLEALEAVKAANEDQSSCSGGAAAAAIAAAKKMGATRAILVDYYTSYDIMPGDSFVGYGGVVWAS